MPTTAPHPSPSTIGRLLAALDTSLYLAAPPGRNRLARILGFYYIMARILVTFVAGLLVGGGWDGWVGGWVEREKV